MNVVYWGVFQRGINVLNSKPLVNIKDITKDIKFQPNDRATNFNLCPSYHAEATKTFNLLAPFDYHLEFKDEQVVSRQYDQEVFDKFVKLNDLTNKLVQLNYGYIFFTEETCMMTLAGPYFTNSDISTKANYMPGSFDISKWFRVTNVSFMLKPQYNDLNIKENDAVLSIKFDFFNNDKIVFKKFYISNLLDNIHNSSLKNRIFFDNNVNKYLSKVYDLFTQSKIKHTILKEIKANLME